MLPSPCCAGCSVCGRSRDVDPVGLPSSQCHDCRARRDIREGIALVGFDLITARMAVAIRIVSQPCFPSRQGCRGALSRRDLGPVAVALAVAMVLRRLRRVQQDLVCLGCFRGHGWHVGVCPRAGCALRTFWWERGRLPPCIH
ncbi:hypothetical protein Taro_039245 [Colocasia esculenta]|uniref:Uncharacterized protein n=1 Tax=Colocasia esculenta TaxID=4460 RepID=A0A843WLM2_COLES|nr:hypothetical protein [Colocasia esculenta]